MKKNQQGNKVGMASGEFLLVTVLYPKDMYPKTIHAVSLIVCTLTADTIKRQPSRRKADLQVTLHVFFISKTYK